MEVGLKEELIEEVYYEVWEIDKEILMDRVARNRDDY